MFPSPNCDNPFEIRSSSSSSFPSDQNPTTKHDDLLFNFPSPFLDEHESPLNQIFLQNYQLLSADHHDSPVKRSNNQLGKSKMEEEMAPSAAAAPPRRRRPGKKDRHSKIRTAQGIRDRRMRLSLQVARKFFDLQDMLGYDKASKTIEWLFTQSNKAIKELVHDHHSPPRILPPPPNSSDVKSESFLSECEDLSGIEEINSSVVTTPATANYAVEMVKPSSKANAKETREKARARARCRTREKMLVKRLHISGDCFKPNPSDNNSNNHIIPFEGVDQESIPNVEEIRVSSYSSLEQQISDVGMIEKFLGNSSCCPIPDYHCAASASDPGLMGFLGNWDVMSNDRSNCFQYSVANNQVSFAGNLNSVFSATAEFP